MQVQIIIPIYYPDHKFICLLDMLTRQTMKNVPVLLIDSTPKPLDIDIPQGLKCQIKPIDSKDFNHGGTRQLGMAENQANIYVFLTQDAILATEDAIEKLVKVFETENIGCVYGRQLPHKGADVFASFAREFNYPNKSYVRRLEDSKYYGMKTAFCSNSFAAYRKTAIDEVGGFPTHTILSEDMCVAAKMLLTGWQVAYSAEASVYHSHSYSIWQEFKRYFDIGVFHSRERWIRESFGSAEGEGMRFVKAEICYILKNNPFRIWEIPLRDGMKYLGYRLGLAENKISNSWKRRLSMFPRYWDLR